MLIVWASCGCRPPARGLRDTCWKRRASLRKRAFCAWPRCPTFGARTSCRRCNQGSISLQSSPGRLASEHIRCLHRTLHLLPQQLRPLPTTNVWPCPAMAQQQQGRRVRRTRAQDRRRRGPQCGPFPARRRRARPPPCLPRCQAHRSGSPARHKATAGAPLRAATTRRRCFWRALQRWPSHPRRPGRRSVCRSPPGR